MRARLLIAAVLATGALAAPAAQADPLDDPAGWCWDHTGFRVGALVCSRLP